MPTVEWSRSRYESDSASYEARKLASEKFEVWRLECDGFPSIRLLICANRDRAQRFLDYFVRYDNDVRNTLHHALAGEEVSLADIIIKAARVC